MADVVLSVKVPRELKKELERVATAQGRGVSAVVREALTAAVGGEVDRALDGYRDGVRQGMLAVRKAVAAAWK